MNKRVITFLLAFFPLMAVNGYCLAANYFESGNIQVNTNLTVLFLLVSLLISASKLFFDFFMTVVASRCAGLEADSGKVLDMLLRCMIPQWIFTLVGLAISRLFFADSTAVTDLILFAAAHTVYYGCAAAVQIKATEKKVFGMVYGAVALVCWVYAIVNLVKLAAM